MVGQSCVGNAGYALIFTKGLVSRSFLDERSFLVFTRLDCAYILYILPRHTLKQRERKRERNWGQAPPSEQSLPPSYSHVKALHLIPSTTCSRMIIVTQKSTSMVVLYVRTLFELCRKEVYKCVSLSDF